MALNPNRQKFVKTLTADDVVDQDSWIDYAHQILGVPYPNAKDKPGLNKLAKEFFEAHPDAGYECLVDVIRWARYKKKKQPYTMADLMGCWKFANADGFMRTLAKLGSNDEDVLREMLKDVEDPRYAERMKLARTAQQRDEIYDEYLASAESGELVTYEDTVDDFDDTRLRVGMAVRFRLTVAEPPSPGTLIAQDGDKLVVYTGDREVALEPRLISIKTDDGWEYL